MKTRIAVFLLVSIFLVNINTIYSCETCGKKPSTAIIRADEADPDLEQNPEASLKKVMTEYLAKGGTLIRLDGYTEPFQIRLGDTIFPACSGGQNRSQTLWAILKPYSDKINLMPPHATRYGFDPYNGQINWHRKKHNKKNDEYIQWAHFPKSTKFGWELFDDLLSKTEASEEELKMLSEYYDNNYYNPSYSSRRVYITFAQNAHIHLYRLSQTNPSLENVVVLFFPLPDLLRKPLPEWNTYPSSVKTYEEFSTLLRKYLDLAQLQ